QQARALVITLPDESACLSVVVTARQLAPAIRIVSRAATWDGARRLKDAGADDIVRPELEGGVEIVRRTLLDLELPMSDVQRYTDFGGREGLTGSGRPSPERGRVLEDLVGAGRHLQVGWLIVHEGSRLSGATLADSGLRASTGVSVVAIGRNG